MPAKAGIQKIFVRANLKTLDSRVRGSDGSFPTIR